MGSLYSIDCLKGREDLKSDIVISTIQKLFKVEPILYVVNGWNRFNQTRGFLDWFYTEVDRYAPLVSVAQSVVACSGRCAAAGQFGPSYLRIQRGVLVSNRRKKDV